MGVDRESLKGLPVEWPIRQGTGGSTQVCKKGSPAFCRFSFVIRSFLVYLFSCESWLTQFSLNFYLWKFVRPGIAEVSSEEYFLFLASARPLEGTSWQQPL